MSPNPLRGMALGGPSVAFGHPLQKVQEIELIKMLPESTYVKLLFSKPVSDWEKMTTFLVKRKLISFAVLENYEFEAAEDAETTRVDPFIKKVVDEKKKKVKEAHEARVKAQAEASAAKKARVAAGHLKRVEEQKLAAQRRKADRAKREAERIAASARRKANAVAATKVTGLKKAADVKVWLEATLDAQQAHSQDGLATRLALQSLPPVLFSKQDVRPVRPLVKLVNPVGVEGEPSVQDVQNFVLLQEIIRSAERHLSYLFHEADTDGWRTVTRKRAVQKVGSRKALT